MQQRLAVELEAEGLRHGVGFEFRPRRLQRPGRMVDLPAVDAAAIVERVEAVALGQPALQGALPYERRAAWTAGQLAASRLRK
jgi:hypothetical protein